MNENKNPNQQKRVGRGCLILVLVVFVLPICFYFGLVQAGSYLISVDKESPVDAIVVLSGEEGVRVQQAIDIYKKEKIRYFVFTKTDQEDIGENRTYSESLMRIAVEQGVAQDSMFVTNGEAASTHEEAKALLDLAYQRGIQSYLIVTDPYHTRRTRVIFNSVFMDDPISINVIGVKDHWFQPETWMFKLTGWKVVLAEYAGLFAFSVNK